MAGFLLSFEYSIGYLSIATAKEAALQHASLSNSHGNIVYANTTTVQGAMASALPHLNQSKDSLVSLITDSLGEYSYPIATFTYIIIRKHSMKNCQSAKELCRYIDWFLSTHEAKRITEGNEMAPLTENLVSVVTNYVVKGMTCNGENVWNMVEEDRSNEKEDESAFQTYFYAIILGCSIVFLILLVVIVFLSYQRIQTNRYLRQRNWEIPIEDIVFYTTQKSQTTGKSR